MRALRRSFVGLVVTLAATLPVRADLLLENPHWDITLTDYGFSDVLFYTSRVPSSHGVGEVAQSASS
jgi:hypothetical protein